MTSLAEVAESWRPDPTTTTGRIDAGPALAFAGLVDAPLAGAADGDPLPPLWHWLYLLDRPASAEIGPDGHPLAGPFLPPLPERRRMFVGGSLKVAARVRFGTELTRRSEVVRVEAKTGGTGEMLFVRVRDTYTSGGDQLMVEERQLMYRSGNASGPPAAKPSDAEPAAVDAPWQLRFDPDPPALFRFSALTYNAHRIHYDAAYAREVENYPDLVVHGPLMALLTLELPRRHAPDRTVTEFSFQARRPAFASNRLLVHGTPGDAVSTVALVVATSDAPAAMTATARLA
jgi:hydroxyacyl-ACP dehydratase HTD2-like protein with hotdog domain